MKEKNEDAKIVWIIGAGASFGNFLMPQSDTGQQQLTYPLINDIFDMFHSYWRTKSYGIRRHNYKFLNRYIRTYFRKILLYDGKRSSKINLNAEDVYTFLDIAIENKPKPYRLLDSRREFHLMLLKLFTALESHRMSLKLEPPHYRHLVDTLSDYDTIITFNWDLLLDFQLDRTTQYNNTVIMSKRSKGEMNYGTRPYPIEYEDYNTKSEGYFLKLHGSVNWLFCSNASCPNTKTTIIGDSITSVPDDLQIYIDKVTDNNFAKCEYCQSRLDVLIIPPTLRKTFSEQAWTFILWKKAEQEILSADEVRIWGYSLPETDYHSTWMLRNILGTQRNNLRTVTLINPLCFNNSGKENSSFTERYRRLFKKGASFNLYPSYDEFRQKHT